MMKQTRALLNEQIGTTPEERESYWRQCVLRATIDYARMVEVKNKEITRALDRCAALRHENNKLRKRNEGLVKRVAELELALTLIKNNLEGVPQDWPCLEDGTPLSTRTVICCALGE